MAPEAAKRPEEHKPYTDTYTYILHRSCNAFEQHFHTNTSTRMAFFLFVGFDFFDLFPRTLTHSCVSPFATLHIYMIMIIILRSITCVFFYTRLNIFEYYWIGKLYALGIVDSSECSVIQNEQHEIPPNQSNIWICLAGRENTMHGEMRYDNYNQTEN